MTERQLELARWLAASEAWRGWCEAHPDERVPSVCPLLDDGWVDDSVPFARFWLRLPDVYLPRLDTSRLVGPLVEMLREAGAAVALDGFGEWTAFWGDTHQHSEPGMGPDTDAEALAGLLRAVVG